MLEDEYRIRLAEQGIVFSIRNQCDSRAAVNADLLKLRRVFANIIGNSIRHAGVASLQIYVSFLCSANMLSITMSDNGHGINETDLPHMFEPFYTSDQSRRISGLGLSICKQIVEGNGGNISSSNHPEGGLIIRFSLPLCK
ncbi:Sensor protein SphS [compost metagenome]